MTGKAPLMCSNVDPMTDCDIDSHVDGLSIWSTIEHVRETLETDIEKAVEEYSIDIASSIDCSVNEEGLIEFECEDYEILKALEKLSGFINAFKIGNGLP